MYSNKSGKCLWNSDERNVASQIDTFKGKCRVKKIHNSSFASYWSREIGRGVLRRNIFKTTWCGKALFWKLIFNYCFISLKFHKRCCKNGLPLYGCGFVRTTMSMTRSKSFALFFLACTFSEKKQRNQPFLFLNVIVIAFV